MSIKTSFLLLIASCFVLGGYASLDAFLTPCAPGDAICLLKANTRIAVSLLGTGVPQLGIRSLEPYTLRNITMNQGFFKLKFDEMNIYGSSNCVVQDVQVSLVQSTMAITLDCPLQVSGIYRFSGKLCFFDIHHGGHYAVNSDSIRTTIVTKIQSVYGIDGNTYWKLADYEYYYEPLENLHIDLGNLFVGNVVKASPFLKVVSNEWWPLVSKTAAPAVDAIVDYFHAGMKSILERIPQSQLYK